MTPSEPTPLELMPLPMSDTWRAIEDLVGSCCEIHLGTDPGGYTCHVTADAGREISHVQNSPSPSMALTQCFTIALIEYGLGDTPI